MAEYTYEQAITALRAADAAGNAEDAQKLAQIAARLAPESPVKQPSTIQKVMASAPVRFAQGMASPAYGVTQILSKILPGSMGSALGDISQNPQNQEQAKKDTGFQGFDFANFAGQIASPVNAAMASKIPASFLQTIPRQAVTGAGLGAAGSLLSPITNPEKEENFFVEKAKQSAFGAVTGAIATPFLTKALQAVSPYIERGISRITGSEQQRIAQAAAQADEAIAQALRDIGQSIDDVPKQQLEALKRQVNDAFLSGKKLDPAATMRKSDFDALNLQFTQGQITRDPIQFARERNLRGVTGVGDRLQALFTDQNQQMQQKIAPLAQGASDRVTAGEKLIQSLSNVDLAKKSKVDSAYNLARDSVGRAAPMDAAEFSRAANLALDEGMLGHYLPSEVRNILNGVSRGEIPFNVNTAVQIDSVLSAAQRTAGQRSPQALAIGKVRDALNGAPIADNVGEDAKKLFDMARALAKERFSLQDAIPALRASATGEIPADDFVRKFVMTAPTSEVKRMAAILDPAAKSEARAQIGSAIQRAAFGENLAGDKLISPERLQKTLRDIGPQKLSAFFSQQEIDQINRIARVGTYINSSPAAATVNTSNTAAALANLGSSVPVVGDRIRLVRAISQPFLNARAANSAMQQTVPTSAYASDDAIKNANLAAVLAAMGIGSTVAGAAVK